MSTRPRLRPISWLPRISMATRAADNGATEAQLMAIFGWTDPKMAAHYTRTANRKRLAVDAIEKLNASGTSIPSPKPPVRAKGQKSK